MRKLLFFIPIFFIGGNKYLAAQETFFPTQEKSILMYDCRGKDGELLNMVSYTITKVFKNGNNIDIDYTNEVLSPKKKVLKKTNLQFKQENDKCRFFSDMNVFLNNYTFNDVEVMMEMPLEPKMGDLLIGSARTVYTGGGNITILANTSNCKVVGIENLTVKAGSFNCYKVSCNVDAPGMGIQDTLQQYYWYAKGTELVKMESYRKGRLVLDMELTGMVNSSVTEAINMQSSNTKIENNGNTRQNNAQRSNISSNKKRKGFLLETGLSLYFMSPKEGDGMSFVGFALMGGYYVTPHSFLAMDLGFNFSGEDIGKFSYYEKYSNGTTKYFTDGKITRDYLAVPLLFSWNYVFDLTEEFHLCLGPAIGMTIFNASTGYSPVVDNTPPSNSEGATVFTFGAKIGLSLDVLKRCSLNLGYRLLGNTSADFDNMETGNVANQLTLTWGWHF